MIHTKVNYKDMFFDKINDLTQKFIMCCFPKYANIRNYRKATGKKINIDNPQTYSEKIRYIMLHSKNNILMSICADKYNVRKYIRDKELGFLLNELYGVYNDTSEIDFDLLPDKFVIKCTHGSGYNIICTDKRRFNKESAIIEIKEWQKENYGYKAGEYFYCRIKPRVICEKYLEDKGGELLDYKIHCFAGKPKFIQVDFDRNTGKRHTRNFYDIEWNDIPVSVLYPRNRKRNLEKPKHLSKMLKYASILSEGFPMVRVDFYYVDEKIIFGELTFAHGCGLEKIIPERFDRLWGSWINLF